MKRLLIDMDGVLADSYRQLQKYEYEEFGIALSEADLIGKLEGVAFRNHDKYVNSPGFFENIIPIEGGIEVLEKLNREYEVLIVSSATEYPVSLTEKMNWIKRHCPFISWKQVVLCGDKSVIKGDIMIDDHFKNLDYFEGETYLFSSPHNMGRDSGKHRRVANWKEVEELLL